MANVSSTPRIFVSHSHHDNAIGLRLVVDLRTRLGDDAVWYDVSGGLRGGDEWWNKIVEEITARDIFIVILSPDAVASEWVKREMAIAYFQHVKQGKRLLPLAYRTCTLSADWELIQSLPLSDPITEPGAYTRQFDNLLESLRVGRAAPAVTPPTLAAPATRPVVRPLPVTPYVTDNAGEENAARLRATIPQQVFRTPRSVPPPWSASSTPTKPDPIPQNLADSLLADRYPDISAPVITKRPVQLSSPAHSKSHPLRNSFIAAVAVLLVVASLGVLIDHLLVNQPRSASWSLANSPTKVNLTNVAMVSANEGWAVGANGTILHYTGG